MSYLYEEHLDTMNYSDIPFRTGDLILFHGNVCKGREKCFLKLLSCCIECCTRSQFSHSGIVIKNPEFTSPPLRGLYLLESTGLENVRDVENNEIKFGVQLRKLDEVLRDYNGTAYWRQLICDRTHFFYRRLAQAHSVVHNRPYDDGLDYIKALFDDEVGNVQKKKTFFCSSLCAYVYVALGFLPRDTPWSIVTPKDLSTEPNRKIDLVWRNCRVHDEVRIKI